MLAFIDESGYPLPTDQCEKSCLAAVCFSEKISRNLTRQLYALKKDLLGAPDVELKGRDFITRHVFDKRPNKKELLEQVLTLVQNMDIGVFSIIMDRPDFLPKKTPGRLENQYRFLLERINAYAQEKYADEMAIVVLDSQDPEKDRERAKAYNGFLYGHPLGQSMNRVLETPLFVDSAITPGLQLADLAASIIRQYHESLFDMSPP